MRSGDGQSREALEGSNMSSFSSTFHPALLTLGWPPPDSSPGLTEDPEACVLSSLQVDLGAPEPGP